MHAVITVRSLYVVKLRDRTIYLLYIYYTYNYVSKMITQI